MRRTATQTQTRKNLPDDEGIQRGKADYYLL
jgi:hypothetical protein